MVANTAEAPPGDPIRTAAQEEWEAHYWCARLSVTPDALRGSALPAGPPDEDATNELHRAARESFRMGGED